MSACVAGSAKRDLFFDVDNIALGLDFVSVLNERLAACDVFVAVIGPDWTSIVDRDNSRRLDDPNDLVRIEIEAALARGIRVIPVLVDGARMPSVADLPESLKALTRRNGIEISHVRFDADVKKLTQELARLTAEPRRREAANADAERRAREAAEAELVAREQSLEKRSLSPPRPSENVGPGTRLNGIYGSRSLSPREAWARSIAGSTSKPSILWRSR